MDPREVERWWYDYGWCHDDAKITDLLGKTLVGATFHRALPMRHDTDQVDAIELVCDDGNKYAIRENHNCNFLCVENIGGSLSALIGAPIIHVEWRKWLDMRTDESGETIGRLSLIIGTALRFVVIDWFCQYDGGSPEEWIRRFVSQEERDERSRIQSDEAKAEAEREQRIRLGGIRFDAMTDEERIAERADHWKQRNAWRGGLRYSVGLVDWSGIFGGTK